jgi:hypothetical protein
LPDDQSLSTYNYTFQEAILLSFKIIRKNCCGLYVHKIWISHVSVLLMQTIVLNISRPAFLPFQKWGVNELCDWLAKYNCADIYMEDAVSTPPT